jgi:TRAP-type C4-dicarboxylate transport system substrate-binding protein
MDSLSDEQEATLAAAAEEAQAFATSSVSEDFGAFCDTGGEVSIATEAEAAALQRAAEPVYRMLEADPQTKAFIDEISSLKEGRPVADVPASCSTG